MASSRPTGVNENISTYGGVTRDYTALATWEAATDVNLVTITTTEVLECYLDSSSYADTISMAGATTSTSYFRIIRPEPNAMHTGVPGTGIKFTGTANILVASEANASIQDVEALLTANTASNRNAMIGSSNTNIRFIGCMAKCTNAGAGNGNGINFFSMTGTCFLVNCLVYETKTNSYALDPASSSIVLYNCTAYQGTRGYNMNTGTGSVVMRNCLASGASTADFASDGAPAEDVQYCASSDATADDWAGTGNRVSQTFTFTSTAGNDYSLTSADAGAKEFGTDLSADGTYPFDDDIIGTTRPQSTSWDIGFHEVIVAAATAVEPARTIRHR